MKLAWRLMAALSVLLMLVSLGRAADGRFQRFDFTVTGRVMNVFTEDMDMDGLLDLVCVHADESKDPPGRYLTIYPQIRDQGFDPKVKIEYTFPPNVAAVDAGDVAATPGRELVFITEKGVYYASIADNRVGPLHEIFKVQSVVAIAYNRDVPYYNFVRDYTGDGKDDIFVSGFYDATIAKQGSGYTFETQTINLRPAMDIDAFDISEVMSGQEHPMLRVAYRVPQIYSEDYNGDDKVDLIASFGEEILIFAQSDSGFSENPTRHYKIKLFPDSKQSRRRGPPVNVNFADLDGDHKVDILLSQVSGTITNIKSRSVLFWGKSKNIESGTPDLEFHTASPVMGKIMVRDVNKDGLVDLILPTYALNAWSVGKALLTGDVNLEWVYFYQRTDRTFSTEPDRVTSTGLKFDLSKLRFESGLPNIVGDFNGDGYYDQVFGEDENTLLISLLDQNGNKTGVEERVEMPVSLINRTVDLNHDGKSDILVLYLDEQSDYPNVFRVLLNVGPWD